MSLAEDTVQPKVNEEEMDTSDETELLRRALISRGVLPGGPGGNSLSVPNGGPSFSVSGAPIAPTAPPAPTASTAPTVSTAPTASTASTVSQPAGMGLQGDLIRVILDQQRQLEQVGVRPRAQPAPGFQVFAPQVPLTEAQQVASSSSLRLGAQLAQLNISQEQSEVQVLRANQLVMQANLLEQNRQQQRAAAEKKVGIFVAKVKSSFFLSLLVIHV